MLSKLDLTEDWRSCVYTTNHIWTYFDPRVGKDKQRWAAGCPSTLIQTVAIATEGITGRGWYWSFHPIFIAISSEWSYTMLPQPTPSHVPQFWSKREIIALKRQQGIINAAVSLDTQSKQRLFILVQATPGEDRMSVCTEVFHHAFHLCLKFPALSPTVQHLPVLSICNSTVTNVEVTYCKK